MKPREIIEHAINIDAGEYKNDIGFACDQAEVLVEEIENFHKNKFKEWSFIAMNVLPELDGKYYVMDKFGNQGQVLYANSGAPNENQSFFDSKEIKAKNIICWTNIV